MSSQQSMPGRVDVPDVLRAAAKKTMGGVDPFAPARIAPAAHEPNPRPPVDGEAGGEGKKFPCPCVCECGNDTALLAADVTSSTAARLLRCRACINAGHIPSGIATHPTDSEATDRMDVRPIVDVDPLDAELDRQIAAELEQQHRREAVKKFEEGLPEKFRRPLDPTHLQEKAVLDRLARFRDSDNRHHTSLLVVGPYGSGKTWVGYSYLRQVVNAGFLWPQEVRHGTEAKLLEPLVYAARWETADRLKELLNPRLRLLMLDDVGNMGRWPDADVRHATYATVLNWLWENDRTIVMTTNQQVGAEKSLERWIGSAAYERLRYMVGGDVIFRNENRRATLSAAWAAEYAAHSNNQDAPADPDAYVTPVLGPDGPVDVRAGA